MATNQESNRKDLYNIIRREFISTKTNKVLDYDEWKRIFFSSLNNLTDAPSTGDKNGTQYQNLYTKINYQKSKYDNNQTIIDYYFKKDAQNSASWRKSLTSKEQFYKTFACDLSWAQSLNFCKGNSNPTNTDLNKYAGNYQDTKTASIVFSINVNEEDNGTKKLILNVFGLSDQFSGLELTDMGNNTFQFSLPSSLSSTVTNLLGSKAPTITFSRDLQNLNYDFTLYKGSAKKIENKPTDNTNKTDTSNTSDTSKSDDTDSMNQKKYNDLLNKETLHRGKVTPMDQPLGVDNVKQCSDFPFTFGCQNNLIGDINQALFKNRISDTFDQRLLGTLHNGGYFKLPGEKEGVITQNLYNQIKKINNINESKKIIKETVKKILKEQLLKK